MRGEKDQNPDRKTREKHEKQLKIVKEFTKKYSNHL